MKTAIIYGSFHHGNTEKLVRGMAEHLEITLINAAETNGADLSGFDRIGFASGIDFGRFYDYVKAFLTENLPENKAVFFLYTCARPGSRFTRSVREAALQKGARILGEYGCKGYNTYGPWKIIGGMNRNHPTETEILEAVRFLKALP